MSFSSETTKTGPLSGDGANTSFGYEFLIIASSHLEVIHADADGIETVLTEGTHYSVDGVGNSAGGTVTYPLSGSPLPANETLTFRRNPPWTQGASFPLHGGYIGPNHEAVFDQIVMQVLYLREELSRAVKVGISTTDLPDNLLDNIIQAVADANAHMVGAQTAQTAAETAQTNAETAQTGSEAAKAGSEAARDQAQTYRDEAQTAAQNTFSTFVYTATGGETSLSGPDDNANTLAYVPGVIIVEMNGAVLEDGVDFTATNGTSITGIAALTAGDTVIIRAFGSFDVTDHETKTSGAHGVVGAFVGTLNTQTLLNKTLEDIVLTGDVSVQGGSGSANNKVEINYNGSTGIAQIGPNSTGDSTSLKLGTSNAGVYADHLHISSDGSMGIGVSPSQKFHVKNETVGGTFARIEANGPHPAAVELHSGHGDWQIGNSITVADTLEFRDSSAGLTRMYISQIGHVSIGATPTDDFKLLVANTGNLGVVQFTNAHLSSEVHRLYATNDSYTGAIQRLVAQRAAASDYSYLECYSSAGADMDAKIDGTGAFYSDPGTYATGADYAEYFEWADGNPTSEDRRGWSVALENGKIRKAVTSEIPFGVISCNPSVVGDAAWNRWSEKYLKDDFNEYIMEDYEVVEWTETKAVQDAAEAVYQTVTKEREVQATETVTEDISSIEMIDGKYTKVVKTETKEVPLFDEFDLYEDGQVIGVHRVPRMVTETYDIEETVSPAQDEKTEDVQHSYAVDQVPDGVVVPVDATRTTQQRRKLNPNYDETQEYTPRSERPEWDCVGLMGKLRLVRGEVVNPNWIKMRDISDNVEEWLVR